MINKTLLVFFLGKQKVYKSSILQKQTSFCRVKSFNSVVVTLIINCFLKKEQKSKSKIFKEITNIQDSF